MCRAQSVLVIALAVQLAHSWDIAVTAGDRIEFHTIDGNKTDTVNFKNQNLTSLTYDEVNNMLLYVDKQSNNDSICSYNLATVEYKCYIEKQGRNIQGLAFDPVTELLFFSDTKERSINWLSFQPGARNDVKGNLLIKMDEGIPTEIAVDSCRGYIYWINTNLSTPTIERAQLNGLEREVIVNATSRDLHSLAIDQQTQKIFWKMPFISVLSRVYSADFDGKNRKALFGFAFQPDDIISSKFDHPNALTVFEQSLLMVDRCSTCYDPVPVFKISKKSYSAHYNVEKIFHVDTITGVGIAPNYKMKKQFRGIEDCTKVPNYRYRTKDSLKIAREYEGPFRNTGVRCETSACVNYCLQGNCSFTEQGLPKCRCEAGYSGERCEVDMCRGYCLNNGICSLNEVEETVCVCEEQYAGERCEVPAHLYGVTYRSYDNIYEVTEPTCQCVDKNEGSTFKYDQNESISNTSTYYSAEKNLTLADLLANWEKPVATISVVVEVKTNN